MSRKFTVLITALLAWQLVLGQNDYAASMQECQSLGYLESQECMEGKAIPYFEGMTYDGKMLSSQSIEGKVAVFNFWFIACPPCIAELPGLNRIVHHYKDQDDVVFISFTREDKRTLTEDFFPHYALDFDIIPDSEETIIGTFRSWWGYPTTMVIDKSGNIFKIISGGKSETEEASIEIEETLSQLIDACLSK